MERRSFLGRVCGIPAACLGLFRAHVPVRRDQAKPMWWWRYKLGIGDVTINEFREQKLGVPPVRGTQEPDHE